MQKSPTKFDSSRKLPSSPLAKKTQKKFKPFARPPAQHSGNDITSSIRRCTMTSKLMKQMGLTFALAAGSISVAMAATSNDFVDKAAQSGITEVEAGKLALQKSSSADVKTFAQHMVDDHTKANQELMALAKKHDLEVPDDAALMDKAKKAILEMRDESFDKAYANNQVNAHEEAVELFKKESTSSDNAELKAFASEKLPTLEKHLKMAKELQSKYAK